MIPAEMAAGMGRQAVVAPAPAAPVVNVYISTPDVEGFRKARSQVAAEISRAVDFGQRNR